MSDIVPLCLSCARFRGIVPGVGYTCEAFGERSIPPEILASAVDHHFPYVGDNGMRFVASDAITVRQRYLGLIAAMMSRGCCST